MCLSDHTDPECCGLRRNAHGHKCSMTYFYAHPCGEARKWNAPSEWIEDRCSFRDIKANQRGLFPLAYGGEMTGISVDIDDSSDGDIVLAVTSCIHITPLVFYYILCEQGINGTNKTL